MKNITFFTKSWYKILLQFYKDEVHRNIDEKPSVIFEASPSGSERTCE